MSKELEALKELRKATTHQIDDDCPYAYTVNYYEDEENIIENALKNYEWLKSKINIDFFYQLSSEDRVKLAEILGVKL